ncbi:MULTISPECIES: methyltransferase domain-containing protein [Planktothrix]|uniref:methyltransferase domain-containing protein n=1 Tax=Planktothrix TaxID=54304 RepID=UPI000408824B|nr:MULTISPECIES: methyltransferase domain-containing protein [Planktothrix]
MSSYTESFYQAIQDYSWKSAQEIVPLVMGLLQPKSVIDIGCGTGSFLSVFQQHGVEDIFGLDGDWVERQLLKIPEDKFTAANLSQPWPVEREFDLAMSVEVAEHLTPEYADHFVDSMVKLSRVCLFSAAIPIQGGLDHFNEQWPEYWIRKFQDRGYVVIDCVRKKVWDNLNVAWWYNQNILLFVQQAYLSQYPLVQNEFQKNSLQFSIVHPTLYLHKCSEKGIQPMDESVRNKTTIQPYSDSFYQSIQPVSRDAAKEIIPFIDKWLNHPKSIVDVGCGTGTWLSVFQERGITDFLGIDGTWITGDLLEIPTSHFQPVDLEKIAPLDRRFDLVISLTLAERIPHDCVENYIDALTQLGSVCLFSAAIPCQIGINHINEQWPDYWKQHFQKRGYILVDCLRSKIWNNHKVGWWYAQNTFLFIKQEELANYPLLQAELYQVSDTPLAIIHPSLYLGKCFS